MEKINDGGPAFPCEQHETLNREWNQSFEPGMSLRDYFAAAALQGYMSIPDDRNYSGRAKEFKDLSVEEWQGTLLPIISRSDFFDNNSLIYPTCSGTHLLNKIRPTVVSIMVSLRSPLIIS